jgi:sterol desaturase/sphingolipid hydroxylase (fatty acid hydroxylase superfamily)
MKKKNVPAWVSAPLIAGAFGLLYWLERRRPLRNAIEPKASRTARNLSVAAISAVALQVTERPLISPLCALVEKRRWGLLRKARLPVWLEVPLAVVLMDYTLYHWHVLTHRIPWLWRFHLVHHIDLDLDASTALRFHFAELSVSTVWRAGQVALLGVTPLSFSVWQLLLFLSILFHHSNVRLPIEIERHLNRFIVTPRMHGIHHSIIRAETDSNWSSGLTVWDRLHGTLQLNVPQDAITIGVPAYREPEEVALTEMLLLPFVEQQSTWEWADGGGPVRDQLPASPGRLLE